MTEATAMQAKSIPFAEQMRPIIAAAMDEGWTTGDLRDAFEQVCEIENNFRMHREAERLYSPEPHAEAIEDEPATTNTTPQAAAIVARHKLPRGTYGIGTHGGSVSAEGSPFDAVAAALKTGQEVRLYRNAGGWRFVGIVKPDGTFVDQRTPRS